MAFATEYEASWRGLKRQGYIEIQRDGFSGDVTSLTILRDSLEIRTVLPSWEEQVFRMNCSFTIINNFDDWFELLPLMLANLGQYRVVITDTTDSSAGMTLFEGYLNVETTNQPIYQQSKLTMSASGYLSKLDHISPDSIETLQYMSLIDLIDDCLRLTGAEYDILVNCTLYATTHPLAGNQTLFNKTAIFTEVFWKNNVERNTALEILQMILKPFSCYLYWYKGYWIIDRYEDAFAHTKTYVRYTTGVSYGYSDTGSSVDIHKAGYSVHAGDPAGIYLTELAQTLSIDPGLRELEVQMGYKNFFNLINADLSVFEDFSSASPDPDHREWLAYRDGGTCYYSIQSGYTFKNISNAIHRIGHSKTGDDTWWNGLSTKFRVTLYHDTTMTIKFKFALTDADAVPGTWVPDNYNIKFYWYLQSDGNYFYQDGPDWYYQAGTPADSGNFHGIEGVDIDPDLMTYEGTINIPVGELAYSSSEGGPGEDFDMIFCMGHERFDDDVEETGDDPCDEAHYGDFEITVSGSMQDNSIKGEITTDFIDRKKIELDLYDVISWSYANALVSNSFGDWDTMTYEWIDPKVSETDVSIAQQLLRSRFRIYNVARQRIRMRYNTAEYFMPFHNFYDYKQIGSHDYFMVCSDIYAPELDVHEVELWEWDIATEVNLT